MKKLIIALTLFLIYVSANAATHTVARGESLESIAAMYHVSVGQLVEANPGADKLFYVGLKLNIPEAKENVSTTNMAPGHNDVEVVSFATTPKAKSDATSASETLSEKNPGWDMVYSIEYGFIPKTEGVKSSDNSAYALTIGANYFLQSMKDGLFVGGCIGYSSASHYTRDGGVGDYVTMDLQSHFVCLPLHIGYAGVLSDKSFAITPYGGLGMNFCVAGKSKIEYNGSNIGGSGKIKKEVGVECYIGLKLRIWGFNIGASYHIPINDSQKMYFGKDEYPAVNIGFGF